MRACGLKILCCRVSGHTQHHNGNLDGQAADLRRVAEQSGATVIDRQHHVGSGTDPYWLAPAVALAKEQGAKLLAECTDRFIRHPAYHSNDNPDAQARDEELKDLAWWAGGVTLVTLLHPDASPPEVRSHQRKRGQRAKGRKGGRPKVNKPGYKKQRRRLNMSKVFWMSTVGFSVRKIAELLKQHPTQIQRWISRLGGR